VKKTKHPNKDINDALKYALGKGWSILPASGHAWGVIRCPANDKKCRGGVYCQTSVWSTPKTPANHAKAICRVVDNCIKVKK
jgi:hypothetical protein